MLRHVIRIGVIALLVIAAGYCALVGLGIHYANGTTQVSGSLNSLRQLSTLLHEYSETDGGKKMYPKELYELVSCGLLAPRDYEKLTYKKRIGYYPPSTSNPSPNHIILLCGAGHMIGYATIDGKVDLIPNNK